MNKLAQVRKEKGVSQLALSKVTNIAPSDISRIENFRMVCYPGWKKRICRALGVGEGEIFPVDGLRQ